MDAPASVKLYIQWTAVIGIILNIFTINACVNMDMKKNPVICTGGAAGVTEK